MATNILLLPQLSGSFTFAANADWRDALVFLAAGSSSSPLDISGISFTAQLRDSVDSNAVRLVMSTDNGLIVSGGANGRLEWVVPKASRRASLYGDFVMDLVASADGATINLFTAAPATVSVKRGVTR